MPEKIYFLAGTYGVGKTTLGNQIQDRLGIKVISASKLISKVNGETYGRNKIVKDEKLNQDILIEEIKKIQKSNEIILNGHFCIFDKNNNVVQLPLDTYERLGIKGIILLEREVEELVIGLRNRDNKLYTEDSISLLQMKERDTAIYIANKMSIPLFVYKMKFNEEDIKEMTCILEKIRG